MFLQQRQPHPILVEANSPTVISIFQLPPGRWIVYVYSAANIFTSDPSAVKESFDNEFFKKTDFVFSHVYESINPKIWFLMHSSSEPVTIEGSVMQAVSLSYS